MVQNDIFEERLDDCNRLKSLIKNFDCIGIDAPWGAGKTFLVDYLCNLKDIQKSYEIVRIEALAYSYNEYDKLILGKIDTVLNQHYIFSQNFMRMQNLIKESPIGTFLYGLFFGWGADNVSNLQIVKKKVNHLDKNILIIFEDIERADEQAIRKIFSIGDRLVSYKIKIIYEYAGYQLDSKGFTREFRNKYISADMHLTSLRYEKLLDMFWKQMNLNQIILDNTNIDLRKELSNVFQYNELRFALSGENYKCSVGANVYPVRWIEHFLLEIKSYLEENTDLNLIEIRVAIRMFFIKNTNFILFEKFNGPDKLDTLFKFQGMNHEEIDLHELTALKIKIENELRDSYHHILSENQLKILETYKKNYNDIVRKEINEEAKYVFSVFCSYQWEQQVKLENYVKKEGKNKIQQKEIKLRLQASREKEINEHINRVLWNILESGKSHLTDNEAISKRFTNEILTEPLDEPKKIKEKYNNLFTDFYYGRGYKDNETTQKIGENFLLAIARSLHFSGVNSKIWGKFIDVYPILSKRQDLNKNFIDICNYIDLYNYDTLIKIMRLFNKQKIDDNLKKYAGYIKFLGDSMRIVYQYGLYDDFRLILFENCSESDDLLFEPKVVCDTLNDIIKSFSNKLNISSKKYEVELTVFREFLQKNIDIYNFFEAGKAKRGPHITITEKSGPSENQKEYDKLRCLIQHDQKYEDYYLFEILMSKYYDESKLNIIEIKRLINEWKKIYQRRIR